MLHIEKRIIIRSLFIFFVFCFSFNAYSVEVDKNTWHRFVVSDRVDPEGEDVTKEFVSTQFNNKSITIDSKAVSVSNMCHYEYVKQIQKPLFYWNNQKTVDLYQNQLTKNGISLSDKLYVFMPVKPSEECPYPFSYFLQVGDSLVFTLNNRLVIFNNTVSSSLKDKKDETCIHNEISAEAAIENGDTTICSYKMLSIPEAYIQYRMQHKIDNKDLLQKVTPGDNVSVKCKNSCINIDYQWEGNDKLSIVENYAGGENHLSFIKSNDGVNVVIRSFPD